MARSERPTVPSPLISALGFHLASPSLVPKALARMARSERPTLKSPLMSPGIVKVAEASADVYILNNKSTGLMKANITITYYY
jgi:hypothetical protein